MSSSDEKHLPPLPVWPSPAQASREFARFVLVIPLVASHTLQFPFLAEHPPSYLGVLISNATEHLAQTTRESLYSAASTLPYTVNEVVCIA